MSDKPPRHRGQGTMTTVFVCAAILYAATSGGDVVGDTEVRWALASRLAHHGAWSLAPNTTSLYAIGVDGKPYSYYGPAQSLCFVPAVLAGDALAAVVPGLAGRANEIGQLLAALLLFPVVGALAVAVLYRLVRELGATRRQGVWLAAIFAVGTMHWQYSVNTYEESQISLCALLAMLCLVWGWRSGRRRWPVLTMLCLGAAMCFRLSSAAMIGSLVIVGAVYDIVIRFPQRGTARIAQWLLALTVGLLPLMAMLGWYNMVRFGTPFETGYARAHVTVDLSVPLMGTPILDGLMGMLFSPGKGLFVFNPVLLPAPVGLVLLWRRNWPIGAMIIAGLACTLGLHSGLSWWAGDLAWGPRYLASAVPLLVVAILPLTAWRGRRWALALIVPSIVIQAASVTYNFSLEFFQDRRHGLVPDAYVWRWNESQLVNRFRNIALAVAGRPDYGSIAPEHPNAALHQTPVGPDTVRRAYTVNFFPFKAFMATSNRSLLNGLLGLWLALVVGLVIIVLRWAVMFRDDTGPPDTT